MKRQLKMAQQYKLSGYICMYCGKTSDNPNDLCVARKKK